MPSIQKICAEKIASLLILVCCCFLISSAKAQNAPLFAALKNNNIQELKALLDQKIKVNVYDDDSDHVLMIAAMYASVDCMDLLIKNGADVNAVNRTGETPLMWCNHDMAKTKLLLDHGADINAKAKSGNTALMASAVGYDQYEIIKLLLDKGADPLIKNNRGETALIRVAAFGDTASARMLLSKGVNINEQTQEKQTMLIAAITNENKEMVYWAVNNGADVNMTDSYDGLPLSYAVVLNDEAIVKALLSKTYNVNCFDVDGMTCLMWACYDEHENPAVIKALIDSGAQVNIKDKKGRTALVWALKKGNTVRAEFLRKAGAQQ